MINHWFEPIFPYNLIYDLGLFCLVLLIFFYFYRVKIISGDHLLLFSTLMLTPFLFNGFLFDWTFLPDQSKYLGIAKEVRSNVYNFFSGYENENLSTNSIKIKTASIFYAFSPILSFDTFKSIAIWNRALFLFMIIFFLKKKQFNHNLILLLIFSPSMIFFSSISLRDNLIVIIMLMKIYSFFEKKNFLLIICTVLLGLIKIQNLFVLVFFLVFNLLFKIQKEYHKLPSAAVTVLIFLVFLFFTNFNLDNYINRLIETINEVRYGFFSEEYGSYQGLNIRNIYSNFSIDLDYASIKLILYGFINFIISPLHKINNIFYLVIFVESLALYGIFFYIFSKNFKRFKHISIVWLCTLTLSLFMYSLVIINDAQIHRYKIPVMFFIIFGYASHLKKKNES